MSMLPLRKRGKDYWLNFEDMDIDLLKSVMMPFNYFIIYFFVTIS